MKKISNTELPPTTHDPIDNLDTKEAINVMLKSHLSGISLIKKNVNKIDIITAKIFKHLKDNVNGRLVYTGAGTSARIAVQDGVELTPTFGWPKKRLAFIIAGNHKALLESVEGAEDDAQMAKNMVLKNKINENDVIIALAASGNTKFTEAVIVESNKLGALTIAISNNPRGQILKKANFKLSFDTGAEVVVGSTRLKAGTVQKVCLNIISTSLMIRMGRVKNGYMSHMLATNKKLKERQIRIFKEIGHLN